MEYTIEIYIKNKHLRIYIASLTKGYVRSRNFCRTSNKDKGVLFLYTVPFPNPFWLHKEILKDLIFARVILFENKIASNIIDNVIFSFIAICLLILALILNATVQ